MEDDEKDLELKDLLIQTLETNGLLAKMKAQIRANVFLALDENEKNSNTLSDSENQAIEKILSTREGQLSASLVRDFLESCNLDNTLAVFDPELNKRALLNSRESLLSTLKLKIIDHDFKYPVLYDMLNHQKIELNLHEVKIDEIKSKFQLIDKGKTGFLKKSKILEIFCETFPNFNRKVLEEFIDIELQADNSESLDNFDVDKLVSLCQKWYQSCYLSLNTLNSNDSRARFFSNNADHSSNNPGNTNIFETEVKENVYEEDYTSVTTPRTPTLEKKINKNRIAAVSDEEIDENISYVEENSKADEITYDKSISTIQGNEADYIEDVSI